MGADLVDPSNMTLLGLFMQAGWIVKAVIIGLVLASVWTWAIMINKFLSFGRLRMNVNRFERVFWSGQSLEEIQRNINERRASGLAAIFLAAMVEWKKSFEKGARSPIGLQVRIDKAMEVALVRETNKMETSLGFLATVGSAAPFVGLFGTVVGIMSSFMAIAAQQNTSLAVVAPGIAEALLATAIGLLAAIPAVVGYNKFSGDVNKISARLEGFADEFSAIISRQIDERASQSQGQ